MPASWVAYIVFIYNFYWELRENEIFMMLFQVWNCISFGNWSENFLFHIVSHPGDDFSPNKIACDYLRDVVVVVGDGDVFLVHE